MKNIFARTHKEEETKRNETENKTKLRSESCLQSQNRCEYSFDTLDLQMHKIYSIRVYVW